MKSKQYIYIHRPPRRLKTLKVGICRTLEFCETIAALLILCSLGVCVVWGLGYLATKWMY